MTAIGVIDERSAGGTRLCRQVIVERDAHVIRVELGARIVGAQVTLVILSGELTRGSRVEHVGVPHGEISAAAVERAGLFSKAINWIKFTNLATNHELVSVTRIRPHAYVVSHGGEYPLMVATNFETERFVLDSN